MQLNEKLRIYADLLRKWQEKINLVSKTTLGDLEVRHFQDSLQIADKIELDKIVFDIGSGAGFPGLVLAMARPDLKISLIESDQKKCAFLKAVSRETNTDVEIFNSRIETVSHETDFTPDYVSARALASLKELLDYIYPWAIHNSGLILVALKGDQYQKEIDEAQAFYDFSHEAYTSETAKDSQVLVLKDIKRCV